MSIPSNYSFYNSSHDPLNLNADAVERVEKHVTFGGPLLQQGQLIFKSSDGHYRGIKISYVPGNNGTEKAASDLTKEEWRDVAVSITHLLLESNCLDRVVNEKVDFTFTATKLTLKKSNGQNSESDLKGTPPQSSAQKAGQLALDRFAHPDGIDPDFPLPDPDFLLPKDINPFLEEEEEEIDSNEDDYDADGDESPVEDEEPDFRCMRWSDYVDSDEDDSEDRESDLSDRERRLSEVPPKSDGEGSEASEEGSDDEVRSSTSTVDWNIPQEREEEYEEDSIDNSERIEGTEDTSIDNPEKIFSGSHSIEVFDFRSITSKADILPAIFNYAKKKYEEGDTDLRKHIHTALREITHWIGNHDRQQYAAIHQALERLTSDPQASRDTSNNSLESYENHIIALFKISYANLETQDIALLQAFSRCITAQNTVAREIKALVDRDIAQAQRLQALRRYGQSDNLAQNKKEVIILIKEYCINSRALVKKDDLYKSINPDNRNVDIINACLEEAWDTFDLSQFDSEGRALAFFMSQPDPAAIVEKFLNSATLRTNETTKHAKLAKMCRAFYPRIAAKGQTSYLFNNFLTTYREYRRELSLEELQHFLDVYPEPPDHSSLQWKMRHTIEKDILSRQALEKCFTAAEREKFHAEEFMAELETFAALSISSFVTASSVTKLFSQTTHAKAAATAVSTVFSLMPQKKALKEKLDILNVRTFHADTVRSQFNRTPYQIAAKSILQQCRLPNHIMNKPKTETPKVDVSTWIRNITLPNSDNSPYDKTTKKHLNNLSSAEQKALQEQLAEFYDITL